MVGSFPGIEAAGTLAPGSQGVTETETNGTVVGRVRVSGTGLPDGEGRDRQAVTVTSGDTSGGSGDLGARATVISPGPQASYTDTGAGSGNPDPYRHPNGG